MVEEYRYDPNGTRNHEYNFLRGITGRNFTYSEEDHLLTAGDMQYKYDLDGFLTEKTNQTNPTDKTSYVYSSRGELLSVTLPNGKLIEYVYDPLGRRIAKKIDGAISEKYLWQGLTRLLAVYGGSDNLLMRFEYTDSRMPVAVTTGGSTYYLTYDQVGSLRVVADSSGNVVKLLAYDSFGNIIDDTNPAFLVPLGFAGGLYDEDTELIKFGYRDYDPDVGRWTAKDPIFFAGSDTDLYGYVLNDPINFFDPWGLVWVTVDHDYDGLKNWGKGALNWLSRKIGSGWDPGIPGSHPSDYERTTRDVVQEWQHDEDNPCKDTKHPIGERRRIKQTYRKKPDPLPDGLWDPTTSHYWAPSIPDRTYEEIPDAQIINDFN